MPYVYPLPDLIPKPIVGELREALLRDDACWIDGRHTAGRDRGKKRNLELDPALPLLGRLSDRLTGLLTGDLRPETAAFQYAADPKRIGRFLFSRTGPGGGYADHMDNTVMSRGTPGEMRSDLSMTIFLSDPASYQGGELVLDSDMRFAPRIKMPAGSAVLYSTTSVHRVEPVTAGERLVAVTWIESRIADPQLRQINADILEVLNLVSQDGICDLAARPYLITKLEKVRGNLVKRLSG